MSSQNTSNAFLVMKEHLQLLLLQLQNTDLFSVSPPIEPIIVESTTTSLRSIYEREIIDLCQVLCSRIQRYTELVMPDNGLNHLIDIQGYLPLAPISRCPDILLDYIFEYVVKEGSHNIRTLLTVNRRFHQLIMSNPRLWRKIYIKIDEAFEEVNSLTPSYIPTCLERSREAALDVVLDLADVCSSVFLTKNYTIKTIQRFVKNEEDKQDIIKYITHPHDRRDFDSHSRLYRRRMEPLLNMIQSFTGPDIHRWRSVFISCPKSNNLRDKVLAILSAETPDLQTMRLEGFRDIDLQRVLDKFTWSKITQIVFPDREDVEIFKLPLNFIVLTKLKFQFRGEDLNVVRTVETLSQCISLQELGIEYYTGWGRNHPHPPVYLHLPHLTSLYLLGAVSSLVDRIEFDLPRLEFGNLGCNSLEPLPVIDALHIKWDVWEAYTSSPEKEETCFVQLLSGFKRAETFTVKGLKHPKLCLATLREMKAAKQLPERLKVISFVDWISLDLSKLE